MATPDIRGAYELLQRAMQQQGANACRMPGGTFGYDPEGYGSPQGGLLGRLLALQAEQNPYQSVAGNNGSALAASSDPNFRQLVRVNATGRAAIDPMINGSGLGSQYPAQSPQTGGASLGVYGDGSAPSSAEGAPTKMAQIVIPRSGGLPLGPVTPVPSDNMPAPNSSPTNIPMPHIPDWTKDTWKMLQIFPRLVFEGLSGGGDDYQRCLKAAGSVGKWNDFCRSLPESTKEERQQRAICWSKAYETKGDRLGWCHEQFGNND
jgi:hypothetical protein